MLLSPDDYLYVTGADTDADHPHGDMDRVLFDGGVMPTRGGYTGRVDRNGDPISRKNILRGEDVCFLAEALTERGEFCDYRDPVSGFRFDPWTPSRSSDGGTSDSNPYPFRTFTRYLPAWNHFTLLHACNTIGTTDRHRFGSVWLPVEDSSLPDSPQPVYIGTDYGDAEIAAYLQGFGGQWAPADDPSWRVPPTPGPGVRLQLSRAPMDAMFESLKLMHTAGYGPIFDEHGYAAPAHNRTSSWQNGAWGPYSDSGAYSFLGSSPVLYYYMDSSRAPQESGDSGWKNPFHVTSGSRSNVSSVDSGAVLMTNVPRGASAYRLYFLWRGSAQAHRYWLSGPDSGKTEYPIDTGARYYMSSLPGWKNVPANRTITLPGSSDGMTSTIASVLPGIRSNLGLTDDFYSPDGVPPFVLGNAITVDSWEYFRGVSASIVCLGVVILLSVDGRTKWWI